MAAELEALGLHESAAVLQRESGVSTEGAAMGPLRRLVLGGEWGAAEQELRAALGSSSGSGAASPELRARLRSCCALLRQEELLEALEDGRIAAALQSLRERLAPLLPAPLLAALAALALVPPEQLAARLGRSQGRAETRARALKHLSQLLPPHLAAPEGRLRTLMGYAAAEQARRFGDLPAGQHVPLLEDPCGAAARRHRLPRRVVQVDALAPADDPGSSSAALYHVRFSDSGALLAASCGGSLVLWAVESAAAGGIAGVGEAWSPSSPTQPQPQEAWQDEAPAPARGHGQAQAQAHAERGPLRRLGQLVPVAEAAREEGTARARARTSRRRSWRWRGAPQTRRWRPATTAGESACGTSTGHGRGGARRPAA